MEIVPRPRKCWAWIYSQHKLHLKWSNPELLKNFRDCWYRSWWCNSKHATSYNVKLNFYKPNFSEGTKTYIYILCQSSTLTWHYPFSWKTKTCLFCTANIMAADDMATQGARASAAIWYWSNQTEITRSPHAKAVFSYTRHVSDMTHDMRQRHYSLHTYWVFLYLCSVRRDKWQVARDNWSRYRGHDFLEVARHVDIICTKK